MFDGLHAASNTRRCCGSICAASRGLIPKIPHQTDQDHAKIRRAGSTSFRARWGPDRTASPHPSAWQETVQWHLSRRSKLPILLRRAHSTWPATRHPNDRDRFAGLCRSGLRNGSCGNRAQRIVNRGQRWVFKKYVAGNWDCPSRAENASVSATSFTESRSIRHKRSLCGKRNSRRLRESGNVVLQKDSAASIGRGGCGVAFLLSWSFCIGCRFCVCRCVLVCRFRKRRRRLLPGPQRPQFAAEEVCTTTTALQLAA